MLPEAEQQPSPTLTTEQPAPEPTAETTTTETPPTTLTTESPPATEAPASAEPIALADLALPEGFEVDETLSNEFLGLINNPEMDPKERASALIALGAQNVQAALERDSQDWDNMQTQWRDEAKAALGAGMQSTLTGVAKLVDEYGTDELRGVLDLTGAGNNVHVINFLSKIASALNEPAPNPGGAPSSSGQSLAATLYPTMKG